MNTLKVTTNFKIILICLLGLASRQGFAQRTMPEVLVQGTIKEQFDYLDGRTGIYNDFRAIREDMFQKIRSNTMDSLNAEKNNILELEDQILDHNMLIDSLKSSRGNMRRAAKSLETTERIFGYKVKKYGINPKQYK